MDQGGSVPLVHVAAFDWPSLPSSPLPASGLHSRDRRGGDTCELNATRRLTAWQCGRSRSYAHAIWLKWRRYEWSSVLLPPRCWLDAATKATISWRQLTITYARRRFWPIYWPPACWLGGAYYIRWHIIFEVLRYYSLFIKLFRHV